MFKVRSCIAFENKIKLTIGSILALLLSFNISFAQTSSLLGDGVNDFIRRSQLKGDLSVNLSLSSRSFYSNFLLLDSLDNDKPESRNKRLPKLSISYFPISFTHQYNSHHPFGWNDGGMIPARGNQTMLSAGFKASYGHFSIQLKPEIVYAANPAFETFPTDQGDVFWERYYQWLNNSDIPEQFGTKAYSKVLPGQSSLRYNFNAVSVGVSTENIWWGPGMHNALIMSNNAPGFAHFTINTLKPIQTSVGLFEGQIIGGVLTSSGILPPERNRYYPNNQRIYQPKRDDQRYLTGMVLSWQPKWVKGLFLGYAKASFLYQNDISGIADILPLEGIIKSAAEKNKQKASSGSLFIRYVMPEEKAELYIEYGRSDKSPNLLNLATDNGYPRAYVAGFRKLFSTKRDAFIQFSTEFTQMQLPTGPLTESASSWYTDTYVRQGYTHQGKVIGAGIGPGSNSQMAEISWVKGFNRIGLSFERIVRNNDFYYNAFVLTTDFTRHWIDLSTTLHVDWKFKKLLLSSELALIRSLNYQWYIFPDLGYFKNGYDVLNFHGRISLFYQL